MRRASPERSHLVTGRRVEQPTAYKNQGFRAEHIRDEVGRDLDGDGDGNGGGDRVDSFFRLFGDSDGDNDVDWLDRDLFGSALEKSFDDTGYLWYFDFTAMATWTASTTGNSAAGSASLENGNGRRFQFAV